MGRSGRAAERPTGPCVSEDSHAVLGRARRESMASAEAETTPRAGFPDIPDDPICAQCEVPMRLQRSEAPYIRTGMTVRVFRCEGCGLLDLRRLRAAA
jgi:hypothetical protein